MATKVNETQLRSASKSFIWRIVGVLVLGSVTYFYTRHWVQTSLITFLHHGIFLFVFWGHERLWLKSELPRGTMARSICKMITYETLAGNIILGIITYLITGDVKQMGKITITYISIKHAIYIVNELLWKRIRWGTK